MNLQFFELPNTAESVLLPETHAPCQAHAPHRTNPPTRAQELREPTFTEFSSFLHSHNSLLPGSGRVPTCKFMYRFLYQLVPFYVQEVVGAKLFGFLFSTKFLGSQISPS